MLGPEAPPDVHCRQETLTPDVDHPSTARRRQIKASFSTESKLIAVNVPPNEMSSQRYEWLGGGGQVEFTECALQQDGAPVPRIISCCTGTLMQNLPNGDAAT
jgi:hypothetical protein